MGISANQARLMTLTARQHDLELRAQQISAEKMIKSLNSQKWAMEYSEKLNLFTQQKQEKLNLDSYNDMLKTWIESKNYGIYTVAEPRVQASANADYTSLLKAGSHKIYSASNIERSCPNRISEEALQQIHFELCDDYIGNEDDYDHPEDEMFSYWLYYAKKNDPNFDTIAAVNFVNASGVPSGRYYNFSVDQFSITNDNKLIIKGHAELGSADMEEYYNDFAPRLRLGVPTTYPTYWTETVYTEITERPSDIPQWVINPDVDAIEIEVVKAEYDSAMASLTSDEKLLDMELTQINTEHKAVKTEYDSVKGLIGENVDKSFNVFS